MAFSNIFSNGKLRRLVQKLAASGDGAADSEQAYLAASRDHQDLERRLRVLDCRDGSVLHTLRVLKISSY